MRAKSPSCWKGVSTFVVTILLCINILSAQNVLEKDTMDIQSLPLHVPSLDELRTVLTEELSKNFAEVSVEIVDCPDLQKPPFNLAASGLGGSPAILDIGRLRGEFIPRARPDMSYDLKTVASRIGVDDKRFIIGAAQGPESYAYERSELVVNVVLNSPASYPGSIAAVADEKNNKYHLVRLPGNETGISNLGNVFISQGKPGKVLQVHVKKRIGKILALSDNMQKVLAKYYPDKLVGLGGTFVSKSGKIRHHLLGSQGPLIFYNMSAPVISAGIIVSAQTDLQLALYHFHSFSDHNDGGHYRNDVTPDEIEYLGYFSPGEVVWRVKHRSADFFGVPDDAPVSPNDWNADF